MIDVFYFDKKVFKSNIDELESLVKKNKKVWVDITNMTKEEEIIIEKIFELHPLTSEDLYNSNIRIKVEEFPNYLFSVFYSIFKNSQNEFQMEEIDFVLNQNFLITNHKTSIENIEKLKTDFLKLELLFKKGIDFIFHKILDSEIDNYFPVLDQVDDLISEIEDKLSNTLTPKLLEDILAFKREIAHIKKVVNPQREKISFLVKRDYKQISKKCLPYIRDVYDHSIRISEGVENYREAINNTFEAYMSLSANRMNQVIKTLTIVATIILPLYVISGIYGTNFAYLPGANMKYGFEIMIVGMLSFSLFLIYLFKKRRWL